MTTVAIIGGGLGGLAAGCILQRAGARCTVYERRDRIGGVASTLVGPQHTLDAGLSWLQGADGAGASRGLFDALGVSSAGVLRPEPLLVRLLDAETGRRLDVTADLTRFETDLAALAPEDGPAIAAFLEGARAFSAHDAAHLSLPDAPELDGVLSRVTDGWRARGVRRWIAASPWRDVAIDAWAESLRAPFARRALCALAGESAPPWRAMMLLGQLARGGVVRVQGGGAALAATLAKAFMAQGGVLRTDARVTRIARDGARATGVELPGRGVIAADAVVCTTDPWQTHEALLSGHDLDASTAARMATGGVAWPTAYVHLLVEGALPDAPWRAQLLLPEPWLVGDHALRELPLRYLPEGEGATPPGHTTVQVAVETSWSWWSDDDAKSSAILDVRRTALVTQVLTRLNALHPGLSRRVRRAEVITPDQFHAATGAHQGITGGWLGTLDAARNPLPQRITGLRNVYRAGQWAASAPGALAAMHAGRQAAQLLAADLGLRESAAPRAIS